MVNHRHKTIPKQRSSVSPLRHANVRWVQNTAYDWVVADLEQEKRLKPILREASEALARFKAGRRSEMTTQMEVCWLRDHFPDLTQDEIAGLIDVPQSLVSRYAKTQAKQRDFNQRQKAT
jgi:predicted XRE-type DNA-binding protein